MDEFLKEKIEKYDRWLSKGKISYSSRVIPINESLTVQQWVLPTEQALEIFRNARSVALTTCDCRSHYQRCDNPLEICLVLNDEADKVVSEGRGRYVSTDEAADVLRVADERGLVHLSLYQPDHELFALCNCCACCCHDLQLFRLFNRKDIMVRSEYAAVTDFEACTHCGTCIDRCVFDARTWGDDQMQYDTDRCYGCGLCVTTCPESAIDMKQREQ